jgi:hypothetical protein
MMMNRKKCPQCKAENSIRKIIYGLPDGPLDESKYLIGGCIVSDNDPTHECIKCGWQRIVIKEDPLGFSL